MDDPNPKIKVLNNRFFRIARKEMFFSEHVTRVGAVMVFSRKNYFVGYNSSRKTHPDVKRYYPSYAQSVHAELNALIKYNPVIHGTVPNRTVVYVYREDKNGVMKNAKPCLGCQVMMKMSGIKKVYYSIEDGYGILYI